CGKWGRWCGWLVGKGGRRRDERRREAFEGHAFKSNRQEEGVQMPGKMSRSDPRPSVQITRGAGSGHTSRLSCKRAGKTRTLMPVWDSSGESRIKTFFEVCANQQGGIRWASRSGHRHLTPQRTIG